MMMMDCCGCTVSYNTFVSNRLNDVLHKSLKLTMVFEYCDQDLKKYFDTCRGRVDKKTVQVYHLTVVLSRMHCSHCQ